MLKNIFNFLFIGISSQILWTTAWGFLAGYIVMKPSHHFLFVDSVMVIYAIWRIMATWMPKRFENKTWYLAIEYFMLAFSGACLAYMGYKVFMF
jgi:hypothetical protein